MDFSLTSEQQAIKALAKKILSEQATHDKQRAIETAGERFDSGVWQLLAETGLLGVAVGQEYGGSGGGFFELMLLVEAVGASVAPVPVVAVLVSAAMTLQRFANDALKQHWLPKIINGECLLTAALIESHNEDPLKPMTSVKQVQGQWLLNGEKGCVPLAKQAQKVLLTVQFDQSLGLVLLDPCAAGVTLTAVPNTAQEPQYIIGLSDVVLEEVDIIARDAQMIIQWMLDRTLLAYCVMQTGIAEASLRMTASYTSERQQFGVPVASFQAVGHRAANNYIDVACQRLVTQKAVSLLHREQDAQNEIHIAKIWTGDCGHRVSYAAQHLHGGLGVDKDYPLWRYCVWSRHIEMLLGSSSWHLAELGKRIAAGKA